MDRSNIYVSSVAFGKTDVQEIMDTSISTGWNLEFSSGLQHHPDIERLFLQATVQRLAHNYFPAPAEPFVLNLASQNDVIRRKSIDHCKKGLVLSKKAGAPFFAAHAGFCIDPSPEQLGNPFEPVTQFDRPRHWSLFLASIAEILKVAEGLDVRFLIENNVVAPFNYVHGLNPLFCCESGEISLLFGQVKNPRLGLLLDTGHLKVSCNTLNLHIQHELNVISHLVVAVHHSDNDGTSDTNEILTADYWFWPELHRYNKLVHVLEVKNLSCSEIEEQIKLFEHYGT